MRLVKLFIILVLLSIVGFLIYKIIHRANQKTAAEQRTAILPGFTFYNLRNAPFTNDSLEKNNNTIIIYFNTGCEHCHYETEQIIKNVSELQQTNFLMVSIQSLKELKNFDSAYNISAYSFIKLLSDSDNVMSQTFGINNVPSIFIYNKNNHLIKKYSGEVKIEALVDAIK